jgi:hypothetical protein
MKDNTDRFERLGVLCDRLEDESAFAREMGAYFLHGLLLAARAAIQGLATEVAELSEPDGVQAAVPVPTAAIDGPAVSKHKHTFAEDGKCSGCGEMRKRKPRSQPEEAPVLLDSPIVPSDVPLSEVQAVIEAATP